MKAVILAGGLGTRLSEETHLKPKPMIEIGNKPILWHIMKIYSCYNINDFVICLGYKGQLIVEYFLNYKYLNSDITISLSDDNVEVHRQNNENWKITLVNTGLNTSTGGRILKVKEYLKNEKDFFLTYGDGVADVNLKELLKFHKKNNKIATLTAAIPLPRFGSVLMNTKGEVTSFSEKNKSNENYINGGFFVLKPSIFNYINSGVETIWEKAPLENLAKDDQLAAFKHKGFWQPMDTLRDKNYLEELWSKNKAPWKIWND